MISFVSQSDAPATLSYLRTRVTGASQVRAERAIFISLLLLILLSAVPFGSSEPWWQAIFESAVFILAACTIISGMIERRWRPSGVIAPLIALLMLAGVQVVPFAAKGIDLLPQISRSISFNQFQTKRFVIELLSLILLLIMLLRLLCNRKNLKTLAQVVVIVGLGSATFALWRGVMPSSWFQTLADGKLQGESFGQFMNRNHFALMMEMSFGVALGLMFGLHQTRRYLYAAIAFCLCVALVLSNSRGGIISMLGQVGFIAWFALGGLFGKNVDARDTDCEKSFWLITRVFVVRCVLIILVLSATLWSVLLVGGEPVRHRLESVPGEFLVRSIDTENTSPRRLEIWQATWRLIKAHPWLGSGLGAYKTAIVPYFRSNDWQPQQAHNEYLELLAGGGIVGGVLGIWFVFNLIKASWNTFRAADQFRRAICFGAVVGLVGVSIHSVVDFGLHVTTNAFVCCALVALATAKVD
jgi:O-antigen ligase